MLLFMLMPFFTADPTIEDSYRKQVNISGMQSSEVCKSAAPKKSKRGGGIAFSLPTAPSLNLKRAQSSESDYSEDEEEEEYENEKQLEKLEKPSAALSPSSSSSSQMFSQDKCRSRDLVEEEEIMNVEEEVESVDEIRLRGDFDPLAHFTAVAITGESGGIRFFTCFSKITF